MTIKEIMLTELGAGSENSVKLFYSYDEDEFIDSTSTLLLSIRTEGSPFLSVKFGGQSTVFSPNEDRDVSAVGLYITKEKTEDNEENHILNMDWEMHIYNEGQSSSSSSLSSSGVT